MVITSVDNVRIAETAKLYDKKYRNRTGRYIIEGIKLVRDAMAHGADIVELFVRESAQNDCPLEGRTLVSDRVFAKISDTVSNQGVLAVVNKPREAEGVPLGNSLVLDGLQDPGNVGTLIRTAAACGFTDIFAVNCVDLYSPKVIRSAMSAHFCVNLRETDCIENVFALLEDSLTVAADMHGDNVFEKNFGGKIALILGNEGNGLSAYARSRVSETVSLPMANNFESLNVAVAGSVIMYRIFSQNQ